MITKYTLIASVTLGLASHQLLGASCRDILSFRFSKQVSRYGVDRFDWTQGKPDMTVPLDKLENVSVGDDLVRRSGRLGFGRHPSTLTVNRIRIVDGKTEIGLTLGGRVGPYDHYFYFKTNDKGRPIIIDAWKNGSHFYKGDKKEDIGSHWEFPDSKYLVFGMAKQVGPFKGANFERDAEKDRHPIKFKVKELRNLQLGDTVDLIQGKGEDKEVLTLTVKEISIKDSRTEVRLQTPPGWGDHSYRLSVDKNGKFQIVKGMRRGTQWYEQIEG